MPDEQVLEQATTEAPTPETPPEEAIETPETPVAETPPPDPVELDRKLKAAEREAERHRKRADYFMQQTDLLTRQQVPVKPADAPESLGPEPLLGQFETTDDWQKAHTQWLRKSVVQEVFTKQQEQAEATRQRYQEQQEQNRVNEQRELIRGISQRDPAFAQAAEIVGQIVDNGAGKIHPAATTLYNELFESEHYEGLVRHLAANPNEIYRITALPPRQQIREIARIENQLPAETPKPERSSTPAPLSPLRLSQAPPPARPPNGASASAKAIDLNDPNVPLDVWTKEHDRREREKRKRGMG